MKENYPQMNTDEHKFILGKKTKEEILKDAETRFIQFVVGLLIIVTVIILTVILSAKTLPGGIFEKIIPIVLITFAALGVIAFEGPQGRGFYKGGHNDWTANTLVCLEHSRRCVLIMANDVRAEAAFPTLMTRLLGDTAVIIAGNIRNSIRLSYN